MTLEEKYKTVTDILSSNPYIGTYINNYVKVEIRENVIAYDLKDNALVPKDKAIASVLKSLNKAAKKIGINEILREHIF